MDTLSVTSGSVNRREAGVRAPRAPLRLGGGGWGVGGRPVRRRCRRRRRCRILLGRPRAAARRGHADSRVPRLLLPLLPAANRPTSAMARSGRRRAGGGRRAAGGGVARPRVGGEGPTRAAAEALERHARVNPDPFLLARKHRRLPLCFSRIQRRTPARPAQTQRLLLATSPSLPLCPRPNSFSRVCPGSAPETHPPCDVSDPSAPPGRARLPRTRDSVTPLPAEEREALLTRKTHPCRGPSSFPTRVRPCVIAWRLARSILRRIRGARNPCGETADWVRRA